MSLDLSKTALQIDQMASELKAQQSNFREHLGRAVDALDTFDADEYERKRQQSAEAMFWSVPRAWDSIGAQYAAPQTPEDFCVVAVDGSHIDIDRHIPARCFLINIGRSVLTYGSHPDARLSSSPRLYARDDELVIRDRGVSYREQRVEGGVLGVKRAVEEMKALAEVVKELPPDIPTLGLIDGSLVLYGVSESIFPSFVIEELVVEGYARALDELRQLSSERRLAIASYISLPRSQEAVNALRVQVCPYDTPDCRHYCASVRVGERPCDRVGGLMDRQVFGKSLQPGARSGIMETSSRLIEQSYGGHRIAFFYVNTGEEIGRVEVPDWIAGDEHLLGLTHALINDQCGRGPGYPVALMEAHEQAVVTGADRRYFVELVENSLYDQGMDVYTSEKSRSKKLRWL